MDAILPVANRTAIDEAKRRGELAQDRDPATLVAAIVGPLFYRRWFSKEVIDDAVVRTS